MQESSASVRSSWGSLRRLTSFRHPNAVYHPGWVSNIPGPAPLKPLTGGGFEQYTVLMYSNNKGVKNHLPPLQAVRILDQVRERIRYLHYSLRTEVAYVQWVRAYIRFHELRHPAEMGKAEVEAFLMWLVAKRNVSSSTHRQALSALLFLGEYILYKGAEHDLR